MGCAWQEFRHIKVRPIATCLYQSEFFVIFVVVDSLLGEVSDNPLSFHAQMPSSDDNLDGFSSLLLLVGLD